MEHTLGIIGTGTMGEAIIRGVIKAGIFKPGQIWAANRSNGKLDALHHELKIHAAAGNQDAAQRADVVILCTKPADLPKVLRDIKPSLTGKTVLISVAAGITTDQIKRAVPGGTAVIRTMPNTPARIGEGMTLIAKHDDHHALGLARKIFAGLGEVVELDESLMNVGTAISGCGPAFLFEIIEGFIMAGVTEGLSREVTVRLVCQTIRGSLDLLEQSRMHPAVLRDEVTSPGGMAAAGLAALTEGGLRTVLAKGISVSARQADRLAAALGD